MVARRKPTVIDVDRRNDIALVTLNRPDAGNALDARMVVELEAALRDLDADSRVRAVVLLGAGADFCAGEDHGPVNKRADAHALARLLAALAGLAKPTIARVHGDAIGIGVGLVACCDIAIAAQDATFALPGAGLGLVPATVAPYLIEAIGARRARRYMLTAETFEAAEAYRIGLVHDLVTSVEALDVRINELLGALLAAGPNAQAAVKTLVRDIAHRPIDARLVTETAQREADIGGSDEGREGAAASREERAPAWLPASLRAEK